jgi:hypothetical protein
LVLEWKSIEKDGLPEVEGYYVIFDGKDEVYTACISHRRNLRPIRSPEDRFYYGPIYLPESPAPKGLTFPEALEIAYKGGKVAYRGWKSVLQYLFKNIDGRIYLQLKNGDCVDYFKSGVLSINIPPNNWIIIEPAPKPKIPEKLKEFKEWLCGDHYFSDIERTKEFIFNKLKPLLEEYSDE